MTQLKQTLWSGFTATLLITSWSAAALPSWASSQDDSAEAALPALVPGEPSEAQPLEAAELSGTSTPSDTVAGSSQPSESSSSESPARPEAETEVVKVGEYQSQEQTESVEEAIANILPHDMDGRDAATLYVRNIPVLTFLGSASASSSPASQVSQVSTRPTDAPASDEAVKVASVQLPADETAVAATAESLPEADNSDPVLRATAIAATLNQLYRQGFNAADIGVKWDSNEQTYVIHTGDEVLVQIDSETILPDTTRNPAEDALQATNRLRRQLGSAPPLDEIEGAPRSNQNTLVSAVQSMVTGMASWYGPGFDGNYSASGEIFNQHALTAAHPSLPFGTQVRVTNLDNGLSVVVRINDRGPHAPGRVIDLSTAAAGVIGLISAGVAPVSLEVVDTAQASGSR